MPRRRATAVDYLHLFERGLGWVLLGDGPELDYETGGRVRCVAEHPASAGADRQRLWLAVSPLPDWRTARPLLDRIRRRDEGACTLFAPHVEIWLLHLRDDHYLRRFETRAIRRRFLQDLRAAPDLPAVRAALRKGFQVPDAPPSASGPPDTSTSQLSASQPR